MKLLNVVDALALTVLRLARAVLGLALFGGALLLAVVAVLAVLLWALLRGRRPVAVRTVWRQTTARRPVRQPPGRPSAAADEVVDVQARELPAEAGRLGG